MSTFLRVCTLLLFVALGASLALCVALGFTPGDAVAWWRGESLAARRTAAPNATPAADCASASPSASHDTPSGSPPFDAGTHSAMPSGAARPAHLANAAAPTEPRRLLEPRTGTVQPTAAEMPSAPRSIGAGDSDKAPLGRSGEPVAREGALCASPPEDQQARLISIIHELVKQPRVQTVSARMPEPAGAEADTPDQPKSAEHTSAAPPGAAKQASASSVGVHNAPPEGMAAISPARGASAPPKTEPAPIKPDASLASPGVRITRAPKKSTTTVEPLAEANAFQIFVKDEDIRQVLALLGEAGKLNILSSPLVTGNVSLSLANVTIDEALDAILKSKGLAARREGRFIYVGTPEEFVAQDKRRDRVAARIYRPNYVSSAEIKNLLTPLLTTGVGKISVSAPAKTGIESNDNAAGGNDLATREAVLVQDFETVLLQMDRVVLEIDRRPLQVAIEAMILSVTLDDEHQCGVDFQFLRNQGTIKLGLGSPAADLGSVSFADGGLKFGYLDGNISTFVQALETIGDTNVISTPRLLTLNKQRAEILIGSELGYVSTTVTETSSTQNVNFLEVGTQLRIRPFISSDGMIRMEIHPELSTGSVRVDSGLTLPDKEVTKVTTNIMVRDGSTVIIGGLMRDDLTKNAKRIPWLGTLPKVGWLFGSKDETTQRHEILVLVTPRIVTDDELHTEGNDAACDFHRRQNVFNDSMSPLGRGYLGRKYFRMAQEAWAAGDCERAMRYIDLSIHINPSDRAAIDLRSDIAAGVKYGEHTLQPSAPAMPAMPEGPPVILNERVIDQAAPRLLPPGATEIPGNRSVPAPNTMPAPNAMPAPDTTSRATPSDAEDRTATPDANPSPSDAAPSTRQTLRKTAFPAMPGRNP